MLAEDADRLEQIAAGAHSSPFHLSRQVRGATGEPPVSLRRRVLMERAAWQLQRGSTVTDAAFAAGFESVEGFARAFSRAYGHPPSAMPPATDRGHWLPAPNGLHFHGPAVLYAAHPPSTPPPPGLYVDVREGAGAEDVAGGQEQPAGDVLGLMVRHDLDDTAALLAAAKALDERALCDVRLPGHVALEWAGPDASLLDVLGHLALSKEPWLAAVLGEDAPDETPPDDVAGLTSRHEQSSGRWLAWVRDVERRGAWADRVIDAICDPPESFQLGQIVAHDLTFSSHRRQLARWMLRDAGVGLQTPELDPDPIVWHRRQSGERR